MEMIQKYYGHDSIIYSSIEWYILFTFSQLSHNWGKQLPFLMEHARNFDWAIFNSYVELPEGSEFSYQ